MKKIILLIIEKIRKALKVDEKGNSFGWGKGTLLLAALMMVGCTPSYEEAKKVVDKERNEQILREVWHNFHVEIIDSCEYLLRYTERSSGNTGYGQSFMSHKGNCRFCKERRKKGLEELVEQLKEK